VSRRIPLTVRGILVILPTVVLLYVMIVAAFATFGGHPVRNRFRAELRATGTAWEDVNLELRRPPQALEEFWRATAVWREGGQGYVFIGRVPLPVRDTACLYYATTYVVTSRPVFSF
jgi:hypothetical protein